MRNSEGKRVREGLPPFLVAKLRASLKGRLVSRSLSFLSLSLSLFVESDGAY